MIYEFCHKTEIIGKIILLFKIVDCSVKLKRIFLPEVLQQKDSEILLEKQKITLTKFQKNIVNRIIKFVDFSLINRSFEFDDELFEFSELSVFEKKILRCLFENVKFGQTITYSRLAEFAGFEKKYARAVGNVMAKNPFPLIFPCHRVLKADGSIGNFQGNPQLKKILLMNENYYFDTIKM